MVRAAVGSRAAAAVDPESPVVTLAASDEDARRMARRLEAVGFRDLRGILAGGIEAWRDAGLPVESVDSIPAERLAELLRERDVLLLDVRDPDEWAEGHVPGSIRIPYQQLRGPALDQLAGSTNGTPIAVACGAGNRSGLAASLLRRAGVRNVIHVNEGVDRLATHGIPLTQEV